jgi:hypothetical protein
VRRASMGTQKQKNTSLKININPYRVSQQMPEDPFLEKLFKKDAEQKGYFLLIHWETDFAKSYDS